MMVAFSNSAGPDSFAVPEFYASIASTIGWTLIHFLWQGLVIAMATLVVLKIFRRSSANVHYFIACAGLLVMAAAPVATFVLQQRTPMPETALVAENDVVKPDTSLSENLQQRDATPVSRIREFEKYRTSPVEATENSESPSIASAMAWLHSRLETLAPWIATIWIIGVAVASLKLIFGWTLLNRLRSSALQAGLPGMEAHVASIGKGFGIAREVTVSLSNKVANPLVVGWLKPLILLPVNIADKLSTQQIKAVLAHEMAHVRRGDFAINILQCVIETLLFFHPCV